MKTYDLPPVWSPTKFIARYSLDFNKDFYVNGEGKLVLFKELPEPIIFEEPDPLPPGIKVRLDAVKTLPELIELLKKEL